MNKMKKKTKYLINSRKSKITMDLKSQTLKIKIKTIRSSSMISVIKTKLLI